MRDKFVSLEQDKCQYLYLLVRAISARNVVEAGTNFGVSTIYLALAVGQNVLLQRGAATEPSSITGKVIAMEKEPSKAERARSHWKEAGDEVEPWIELREGNLLETLTVEEGMPEKVDLLLLDSKLTFRAWSLLPIHMLSLDPSCAAYSQNHPATVETRRSRHHR